MKRCEMGRHLLPIVLPLCAVVLTGCGGSDGVSDSAHDLGQVTVAATSPQLLNPLQVANPDHLRWRDLADQLYSDSFRSSFSYFNTSESNATVSYEPAAATLSGTLAATGLKPWFAYQMKLTGKAGILGADEASNQGDALAWSSYQLGQVGRWWCNTCGWNLSDRELKSHLNAGHTIIGYLLFDWFATDALGNATHAFALDSSFHVLWKTSQWPPAKEDSQPTQHKVVAEAGGCGYDRSFPPGELSLYAEAQTGRPPIGQVRLPAGDYRCFFLLTEESFHDYTNPDGGDWAAALAALIEFTVIGAPPVDSAATNP